MAIVKWDPLRELRAMQEQMNRLFEMSRDRTFGEPFEQGGWQPPVDIYEDDREVVVKMEVPEVDQQDIDVHVEEHTLIIQGERKLEREEKKQNYHRIERCYGPFRRSFFLPATVDQERISATCERGVLQVVLPKKIAGKARQIEVEVK
jgi:HSP20 family protein